MVLERTPRRGFLAGLGALAAMAVTPGAASAGPATAIMTGGSIR